MLAETEWVNEWAYDRNSLFFGGGSRSLCHRVVTHQKSPLVDLLCTALSHCLVLAWNWKPSTQPSCGSAQKPPPWLCTCSTCVFSWPVGRDAFFLTPWPFKWRLCGYLVPETMSYTRMKKREEIPQMSIRSLQCFSCLLNILHITINFSLIRRRKIIEFIASWLKTSLLKAGR